MFVAQKSTKVAQNAKIHATEYPERIDIGLRVLTVNLISMKICIDFVVTTGIYLILPNRDKKNRTADFATPG